MTSFHMTDIQKYKLKFHFQEIFHFQIGFHTKRENISAILDSRTWYIIIKRLVTL